MIKKTITYQDYNGIERSEDFYFNFTETEVLELEMGIAGGLSELLTKIINSKDQQALLVYFKEIILKAYGEKDADGKHFTKFDKDGHRLADRFAQTEAFSKLYMELAFDADKAAEWVNGVIPKNINIPNKAPNTIN